jgi:multidrug efflux pump subunit AcrA (membrane-fusion protein)
VEVKIPLEQMRWIQTIFDNGRRPTARVRIANFDDPEKREWEATVARVKARVDDRTRTLPMTLEITAKDPDEMNMDRVPLFDLKPGTFVGCTILGETYDNIFVVPRHLLKPGDVLYLVTESRLEMRKVRVLRKFEEQVYINGGLGNGDKIIESPVPGAIEGMELIIKENGPEMGKTP